MFLAAALPLWFLAAASYAPLWLYNGSWQVTRNGAPAEKLVNACSLTGQFFVCEQTVNQGPPALLIFVPAGQPGRWYTQTVTLEGRGTRRGDLEISGDRWVFSSTWNPEGKTVYYRTTNVFSDKNHIHFEQAESADNKTWVVKVSGDEVRTAAGVKPRR
jgi:hypothetical protein